MSGVDIEAVLYASASTLQRRYAGFVDRDDLLQEGRIWLWEHDTQVQEKLADEEPDARTASWLGTCLQRAMEVHARKCKAQGAGYDPEDEAWYPRGVVALVLPKVLAGDREPPTQGGLDGMPRGQSDPAESSHNWTVMYADVEKALGGLTMEDIALLVVRHHEELTFDDIAQQYGWGSPATAQRNVRRVEGKLIQALGGFKPSSCPEGCEHLAHDSRLRRRPGKNEETW